MSVDIATGASTAGKANVDGNYNLNVTLPIPLTPGNVNNAAYVGAARNFAENDAGTVLGAPYLKSNEVSFDYRLRVGMDTLMFQDNFNAPAQNTNLWAYAFSTLTAAQLGAGSINFGAVQGTANSHGAYIRSWQYFPLIGTSPTWVECVFGQFTAALTTNEGWAIGVGVPVAAGSLPTDGVWFQLTNGGLIGYIVYNGTPINTGVIKSFGSFTVGAANKLSIGIGENSVEWWCDDVLLAKTNVPAAQGQPFLTGSLPVFAMKYCTGAVSNTNTMRLFDVTVTTADIAMNKPWSHQMAGMGSSAFVGQNGQTQGKAQWWTNSVAPSAAAMTNTAVISGANTLGGLVAILPTLAANSDGIVFSYTNPSPGINVTGRNFICTGVKVQGAVSVVLAGGPVVYAYALAFGHTAVSLVTAETGSFVTATAHEPRRAFIGMESYANNAAVGVIGQGCELRLDSPICVRPGEQIAVTARNLGVITTTGAITVGVTFQGYWE